tara:strand:- start:1273 stop:2763 length:1491 start_codon:yes stop_codon:yes gene_type:complete
MIIKSFLKSVKLYPKQIAIITETKKITYLELYKIFSELVFFLDKKILKNKRLIIALDNSEKNLAIYLACMFLKITIFPINKNTSLEDIELYAKEIKTKFVITEDISLNSKILKIFKLKNVSKLNIKNYNKIISNKKNFLSNKEFDFIVALSSGTTGKRKKIILTDNCKFKRAQHTINYYKLGKKIKTIICTPMYHSLAQRLFFISIISGGYVVILKKFSLEKWFKFVKSYRVNFSMLVSTHLRQFLNSKNYNFKLLKNLKNLISSSDSISRKEKELLSKKFSCNLHEIYGTSETATISNLNIFKNKSNLSSVGKLLDDTKVKIKNKKNGIGEIYCKNSRLFKGYLGSSKKNNFFATGDLGYLDRKGFLYFVGRNKDIIKISGMNIYPLEIETKIKRNNLVKECAVIGEPNSYFGEIIKMFVVPINNKKITRKKIMSYIYNSLNEYEKPQKINFTSFLPRNSLGKINKLKLKKPQGSQIKYKTNSMKKYLNLINQLK